MTFHKVMSELAPIAMLALVIPVSLPAQTPTNTPDFSGVYYPLSPFGRGGWKNRSASGWPAPGTSTSAHSVGATLGWLAGTFSRGSVSYSGIHGEVAGDQ